MILCDWIVDIVDFQRLKKSNMNDSWFFDENFTGVSDEFFDDVIKHLDFPLEDLEPNEDWNSKFQSIEPPLGILSDLSTDFSKPQVPKNIATSYNRAPQLKAQSSTADTPSSGSALLHSDSNDGKDSQRFQSSSPVSVLGSSGSCSAENSAPVINPKLVFPVKRTRSKRQRPLTFKPQFVFPFFASESELESPLTEKPRRKKLKLKKNLTVLSGTRETKKPYFEPSGVTRKCTHCEVTETPQWREGPQGPKTLCNACGVRYRSGRLLPEYRPAASPTFIPSVHSNSHKRILEMRNTVRQ